MLFGDSPVLVRGGGDLATGVVARLRFAGFPVGVTELDRPLTVRRTVAVSSAIYDGEVTIEGVVARRVENASEWAEAVSCGEVPVTVSAVIPSWLPKPAVIVDARLAKRNIDTRIDDAELVIGLGPGFTAATDCHVVIETKRGSRLGRMITEGPAEPNTGTPGIVGGHGAERVLRAPAAGHIQWDCSIGDKVADGQVLGRLRDESIRAPFAGVVRGLIHPDCPVTEGLKVGDVDPRADALCSEISDKALAIGGGVLTAALGWLNAAGATR